MEGSGAACSSRTDLWKDPLVQQLMQSCSPWEAPTCRSSRSLRGCFARAGGQGETALQRVVKSTVKKAAGPSLTQLWCPTAPGTTHTSPVLSDHQERWSPKSKQLRGQQWTVCREHRSDTHVSEQSTVRVKGL